MRPPIRSFYALAAVLLAAGVASAQQVAVAQADSIVADAVAHEFIPGAVLLISQDDHILLQKAYGYAELFDYNGHRLTSPRRMRTSTVFDLASITKVMATTYALMLLVDRGLVDVDQPVYKYLPEFRGAHLDSITVRHLLQHSSGLNMWQPLYYQASNKQQTFDAIRKLPLQWGVGEGRHYSDLGFMLLGYIVERVSGKPLDEFVRSEIYQPLGLKSTMFNPRAAGLKDFAVTEHGNEYEKHMVYDSTFGPYGFHGDPHAWNGWRTYSLNGEVDDGNAYYAHGGVAGLAGLFSTATELNTLLQLLMNGGTYHGHHLLSEATIRMFLTKDQYGHYLGWQYPPGTPEGTFAHPGFTGTYVLGAPARKITMVLLTNRENVGTNAKGYFPNLNPMINAITKSLF